MVETNPCFRLSVLYDSMLFIEVPTAWGLAKVQCFIFADAASESFGKQV